MKSITLLALFLLVGGLGAQTNKMVIPAGRAKAQGNAYDTLTFFSTQGTPSWCPVHQQWIYDAGVIPLPGVVMQGMALRKSTALNAVCHPATASMRVALATGNFSARNAPTEFAKNLKTPLIEVFKGSVNLPQNFSTTGLQPFTVVLPFSRPYPFVRGAGKSFVIDITTLSYSSGASPQVWFLDSVKVDMGSRVDNYFKYQACPWSNLQYASGIGVNHYPYLGAYWEATYSSSSTVGLPSLRTGIGAIGFIGAGGTWGGIRLPFDLAPLGAPGCVVACSLDITVPLITDSTPGASASWPRRTILIPNDINLIGAVFYDQGLFFDPGANAANLVTTRSSKWTIGTGKPPGGCVISKINDSVPPATTGNKHADFIPVVEFSY